MNDSFVDTDNLHHYELDDEGLFIIDEEPEEEEEIEIYNPEDDEYNPQTKTTAKYNPNTKLTKGIQSFVDWYRSYYNKVKH